MKGKLFIDTNIFIRPAVQDNKRLSEECMVFLQQVNQGIFSAETSGFVLAEVAWLLKSFYKQSHEQISAVIEGITAIKNLGWTVDVDILHASNLYKTTGIKFSDCYIAAHRFFDSKNSSIVSLDKDFDKLGIKRFEPGQLL